MDLVCTHIHRHLDICIECHYCPKTYWSVEGWKKHTGSVHPNLPKVPEDAEEPSTFSPLGDTPEILNIKEEEEQALKAAVMLPASGFNVEKELILVDVEEKAPSASASVPTSTPIDT